MSARNTRRSAGRLTATIRSTVAMQCSNKLLCNNSKNVESHVFNFKNLKHVKNRSNGRSTLIVYNKRSMLTACCRLEMALVTLSELRTELPNSIFAFR